LGGAALGEPMGKGVGSPAGGDAKTGAAAQKAPGLEGRSAAPGAPADTEGSGGGAAGEKKTGVAPAKPAKESPAAPGAAQTEPKGAAQPKGANAGAAPAAQTEPKGAAQPKGANAGAGPDHKAQTGRSSAANITSEDRTKVRSEISRVQIREATNLNFSVNVGVTAPRTITEYWAPVPQEILTIVPAWSGYRVVRIGNEILIIEPDTYQIVDVLED
jgi:hypothetical protein